MQISSQSTGIRPGNFVLVLDSGDRLSMFGDGHLSRMYADRLMSDTGYETSSVILLPSEVLKLYHLLEERLIVKSAKAEQDSQVG